jgi:hypothetical protein
MAPGRRDKLSEALHRPAKIRPVQNIHQALG